MKITSVERYKGAFITAKVNTDKGIGDFDGAELSYGSYQNAAWGDCQDFTKTAIGVNPFDTEKIYEHLHRYMFRGMGGGVTVSAVMAAVNITCWDIKGKVLGLPVYKPLGGKTHDFLQVHASQLQMRQRTLTTKLDRSELQFGPKDYYDAVKGAMVDGYDVVKIDPCFVKLSRRDFSQAYSERGDNLKGAYPKVLRKIAVRRIAVAREAGGDESDIIIEVHSALNANTVMTLGKSLKPYHIMYYEESTMPSNPKVFKHIKRKYDIPLTTSERSYTRWGFGQLFEDRILSIAQSNLCSTNGIAGIKEICDMANVYGIDVQLHVCGGPIAATATLHMEVTTPNFVIHEEHYASFKVDYQRAGKYVWAPENDRYVMNERPGIGQGMGGEAMTSYVRVIVD